jgi:hypothetical protein
LHTNRVSGTWPQSTALWMDYSYQLLRDQAPMSWALKENQCKGKGNPVSSLIGMESGKTGAYRAYKKGYTIMLVIAFLTGVTVRLSFLFTSTYAL